MKRVNQDYIVQFTAVRGASSFYRSNHPSSFALSIRRSSQLHNNIIIIFSVVIVAFIRFVLFVFASILVVDEIRLISFWHPFVPGCARHTTTRTHTRHTWSKINWRYGFYLAIDCDVMRHLRHSYGYFRLFSISLFCFPARLGFYLRSSPGTSSFALVRKCRSRKSISTPNYQHTTLPLFTHKRVAMTLLLVRFTHHFGVVSAKNYCDIYSKVISSMRYAYTIDIDRYFITKRKMKHSDLFIH